MNPAGPATYGRRAPVSMPSVHVLVLLVAVLVLLGIGSSKFSARIGMPVLVLFLGVGMLAGSEGLGGVPFEDYGLANAVGSLALAVILFDGGLQTTVGALRAAWRPALSLATVGVLVTSGVAGLAAAWVLGIPMLHGLLLGAIVGSTDAAAVFSVMRTSGVALPDRLGATLEVESGSNDPMAIFLTLGLLGVVTGTAASAAALASLFVLQFGVGTAVGVGVGLGAAWAVDRADLDAPGLYPILVSAFGLLAFGLAAVLGGSGFLAVYLAGVVLGNRSVVFRRGIFLFHDAAAWLAQIVLFVLLGLLSFPSRLLAVAGPALAVAAALILVARPVGVALSLAPFRFAPRETAFVSWVGLKGAVPITLATFPLLAGMEGAAILFDVVFFVVLVSAVTQGWSLPVVARWLGVGRPADPSPPLSVELHALRHVDGDVVDYTVAPSARVAGQALRDLPFPDGAAVTLVVRDGEVVVPRGATTLRPGDHVFAAMRPRLRPFVDRLFDPEAATPPLTPGLALGFARGVTVGQLHRLFGVPGPTWSTEPVGALVPDDPTVEPGPARLGPFVVTADPDPELVRLTFEPLPDPDEAVRVDGAALP